jgi:hypothetical protein
MKPPDLSRDLDPLPPLGDKIIATISSDRGTMLLAVANSNL